MKGKKASIPLRLVIFAFAPVVFPSVQFFYHSKQDFVYLHGSTSDYSEGDTLCCSVSFLQTFITQQLSIQQCSTLLNSTC